MVPARPPVRIDAHHGDGVQAAFYADPRVLTISLHQHPATLFPYTGLPAETGGPGAEGSAVNVAPLAGTRDAGWLRAFHAIVPPLLRQFGPQLLVSQLGRSYPGSSGTNPTRGRHRSLRPGEYRHSPPQGDPPA
jgi:Histone deacetylase domain